MNRHNQRNAYPFHDSDRPTFAAMQRAIHAHDMRMARKAASERTAQRIVYAITLALGVALFYSI